MFLKTVFNSFLTSMAAAGLMASAAFAQPGEDESSAAPAEDPAATPEAEEQPAPAEAPAPAAEEGPAIELPEADAVSTATPHSEGASSAATMIGGYGELHFNRAMPEGGGDSASEIDFHRMVVYLGKQWTDDLRFYSELEVEHAITGDGKPGEVALEQAFVEYRLADETSSLGVFGVRAGIVLIPMGITNQWHEPPIFHGVERPRVENRIIPTTWREGGAGVYGRPTPEISYELYVVGGLDPLGFSASSGLRGGRQKVGEARADGLAVTGRVEYRAGTSTVLGGAGYFGLAGPNAANPVDAAGNPVDLDVPVAGFAVDARTKMSGFEAKALFALFTIGDTDDLLRVVDPVAVAGSIYGVYGELAYDVLDSQPTSQQLLPFARLEYYSTEPDEDPDNDPYTVMDVVFGLSYRPISQVVFKGDFTLRRPKTGDGENILGLGVGFLY